MASFNSETKVFCGPKSPKIFHPQVPLGQVLLYECSKNPDKVIQICAQDGVELTNQEMSQTMTQIAMNLIQSGLKFGDVVGFCGRSSTVLTTTGLGCVLAGLPMSPVDISLDAETIFGVYKQTYPKVIFCDNDQILKIQEVLKALKRDVEIITLNDKIIEFLHISDFFRGVEMAVEIPQTFACTNDQICVAILPSSGSTGSPKLTRVSHAQLLESVYAFSGFVENTIMLNFFTLFWISGVCSIVHGVLNQHTRLITSDTFTPQHCVEMIEKYKVTQLCLTPSDITSLLEYIETEAADLSSIKLLSTGGWFISEHTIKRIESHLPNGRLIAMYGMTETAGTITRGCVDDPPTSSVGRLCVNTQAKILMEDGSLGGVGDIGEIILKRNFNIIDYLHNEQQTRELIDDDLWIHTGDMGYFDDDFKLFIAGRRKFIIRCCNRHVHPTEIEAVIEQLPGVLRVCVVAIPDCDSYEAPCAVIVKSTSSSMTENDVKLAISHLDNFKQLKCGVFFVDDLPLTATGKIQRVAVEKVALGLTRKG